MGLSHEENLLDLTSHDLGKGCGSGRLFAVVFPRSRRASFSEFRRASSLKLVRPSATAREHSRSRIAFGEETLTSCLTRVGGPEIQQWRWPIGQRHCFLGGVETLWGAYHSSLITRRHRPPTARPAPDQAQPDGDRGSCACVGLQPRSGIDFGD